MGVRQQSVLSPLDQQLFLCMGVRVRVSCDPQCLSVQRVVPLRTTIGQRDRDGTPNLELALLRFTQF